MTTEQSNMFKTKIQEALQNTDLIVSREDGYNRGVDIKMPDGSILCMSHFENTKNNKIEIYIYTRGFLCNSSFTISNGFDSAEFTEKFSKKISEVYEKTKQKIQRDENLV